MSDRTASAMDALAITDFLQDRHTGVLSIGRDDDSYAIPVSFTYVPDDEDAGPSVYLRLGFGPNSQKREYLDAVDYASFVVYDHTDQGWKSVVARGPIEELSRSSVDSSVVESVRGLDIPYFRVFDEPSSEIEFSIVRIDVEDLSGIVSGGD